MEFDNYKKGKFVNLEPTPFLAKSTSYFSLLWKSFIKSKTVKPSQPIPYIKTDLTKLTGTEAPVIVWFGHSSYLIISQEVTILIDPVFNSSASPIPGLVKPFSGSNAYTVEDLPAIDFVLITHNHYDHLDKKTISKLREKTEAFFAPTNVAKKLKAFGVRASKIDEFDWGASFKIKKKVKLRSQPARHFSGRGLRRNRSLWSSYILELHGYKLFLGRDSGYGKHFKEIGSKYGPFDFAFLECGQYDSAWPYIHMQPEETLKAAEDLGVKTLMPVHWAKFALANHPWFEPPQRLAAAAEKKHSEVKITFPKIGQPIHIHDKVSSEKWWQSLLKN